MTEKLNFRIYFKPGILVSQNKWPEYRICVDNVEYRHGFCTDELPIGFQADLEEGEHKLQISFTNKNHSRNTVTDQQGNIVEDLNLQIDKVEIDDIELGTLMQKSVYELDEEVEFDGKRIKTLPNHLFMSWNGTVTLTFTSPFYLWLLENL